MNRKILIFAFISFSSNFNPTIGDEPEPSVPTTNNTEKITANDYIELITKSELWFDNSSDLENYDIYHQDIDRVNETTKYVNKRFPSLFYQRDQMDSMEKVIILHSSESGLKDNMTYIVFRQTLSHPKHYTGHLAYIRKFRGQVSLEWDTLRSDFEEPQGVFAATFIPYTYGINSVVRSPKVTQKELKEIKAMRRRKRSKPNPVKPPPKPIPVKAVAKLKSKPMKEVTKPQLEKEIEPEVNQPIIVVVPILQMSTNDEEISASVEEDPYIPGSEDLSTRRPNMEIPFRFKRWTSSEEYYFDEGEYTLRVKRSTDNEENESEKNQAEYTESNQNKRDSGTNPNDTNEPNGNGENQSQSQGNTTLDNQVSENVNSSSVNSDSKMFQNKISPTLDEMDPPSEHQSESKDEGNHSLGIDKLATKIKRPLIIPNAIFDDSKETSASIELSIEDTSKHVIGRDGRKSSNSDYLKKRYQKHGRNLASFFGRIGLNDTVLPEERLPINEVNIGGNEHVKIHGEENVKMVIQYDPKSRHPAFEDRSSPFTGILDCNYENVTLSSGEFFKFTSDKKAQLVGFLLKTLRAQCLNEIRENTLGLFLEDLVTLGTDMKVDLNMVNSIYNKKTLSKTQWDKVISAIYFVIYTDAYRHHAELISSGATYSRSPDALKISLSVRTLTTMVMRGMEIIHDLEAHAVKISKSLITALNERYLHSLKEASLLKSMCTDCSEEEDANYQDRIQIRALKEFVIFGIADNFEKKGPEMEAAFVEFYQKRLPILTGKNV